MEYYLGIIRYMVKVPSQMTPHTMIGSKDKGEWLQLELHQLIKASTKELAKETLEESWEKENKEGYMLRGMRINDTIIGK